MDQQRKLANSWPLRAQHCLRTEYHKIRNTRKCSGFSRRADRDWAVRPWNSGLQAYNLHPAPRAKFILTPHIGAVPPHDLAIVVEPVSTRTNCPRCPKLIQEQT